MLGAAVGFDAVDYICGPTRHTKVAQCLRIDREVSDSGTVLGCHVSNCGTVGQRHGIQARAVELHELVDHTLLAKHLGHGEDKVGSRDALTQPSVEPEPDHVWKQHIHRLTEHDGFCLDATDTPAYNS